MLYRYFIRPDTVDRIRECWIGEPIERYVAWLNEKNYARRTVFIRVPLLVRFGRFAQNSGATSLDDLPSHIESFVEDSLNRLNSESKSKRLVAARELRNPINQMLRLVLPHSENNAERRSNPFSDAAPCFFEFLRRERGFRDATLVQYRHCLEMLQEYLQGLGRPLLPTLTLPIITAFITKCGETRDARSVQSLCSILKCFCRYLFAEGLMARDLAKGIESPRHYRYSNLPRSITWHEVEQMLQKVDRRSAVGRRDYAILLLLVTYGLRSREVAALTLDDLDWKRDCIHVGSRKAGHSTAYPLTPTVGEAILDYLRQGRPVTNERAVFMAVHAPYIPMSRHAVSSQAKRYIRRAGINVHRPGSHTLRHTCVQRLVDSGFSLKTIGDFVGHRTPDATKIYAKVNIEALRRVALGNGEEVL